MKKSRIFSLLMAAVMILPQFTTGLFASASSSGNYIKPSEEIYVNNGTFDEAPNIYGGNLNYNFTQTPDDTWAYSTGAGTWAAIAHETGSDGNKYLHVTSDATPSVSYASPEIIPAGNYTLSMSLYVEDSTNGTLSINYTLYNGNSRLIEYTGTAPAGDGNVTVPKNNWTTVQIPLEFKEDTDFAFRFWGANNYRIDDVSIGNPSDILIETADLTSVNTSSNVSTLDETALPDGVWSSNHVTDRLTFVPGSNKLSVKRNAGYAGLAEPNNVFYAFSDKLSKGEYRLSFELNSAASQKYTIEIANANNGWPWGSANAHLRYVNNKAVTGANLKISETFTVEEDNTFVAFKINPQSYQDFTIDNVKLEKGSTTITVYENDFSSADKVTVGNSGGWHTNDPLTFCTFNENSEKYFLGYDQGNGGRLKVANTDSSKQPSLAFNFGLLTKGSYELTFKTYFKTSDITGAVSFTRRLHDNTAGQWGRLKDSAGTELNDISLSPINTTVVGDETVFEYKATFEIVNDCTPLAIRMWGPKAITYYVDDFNLTGTNIYEIIDSESFTTAPTNQQSFIDSSFSPFGSWASAPTANNAPKSVWSLGYNDGCNGTLSYDSTTNSLKLVEGTLTSGQTYNIIHSATEKALTPGDYSVNIGLRSDNSAATSVTFDVRKTGGTKITSANDSIPKSNTVFTRYSIPFTLDASSQVVWRVYGLKGTIYADDYMLVSHTIRKEWNEVTGIDYTQVHNTANANVNKYDTLYALRGKWITNLINPLNISYDSTNTCIKFTGRPETIRTKGYTANAVAHDYYALYGFENTLTKGDYSVNVSLATYGIAGETYQVAVYDRDNFSTPITSATVTVAAGTGTSVGATSTAKLQFNVTKDTDAVLRIDGYNSAYHYCAYDVNEVTLYKLALPVIGFSSNHIIAQFDSDEGTYYMAIKNTDNVRNSYLNYNNPTKLGDGIYILRGMFRTTDPNGATVSASIGLTDNQETAVIGTEWTPVSFTFTLKNGVQISNRNPIGIDIDSPETFYFKDFELVLVDDIPTPALNSGIAMVLLKKMQGKFTDPWKQIGIN